MASTRQVDVASLTVAQLREVQQQLQVEIEHLTSSFEKLRQAQDKFNECADTVKSLSTGARAGQELLVPLTSSLYVPGVIGSKSLEDGDPKEGSDTFLVDIGTGYFVEKSGAEAEKFFKSKTKKLDENTVDLEKLVKNKVSNLQVIQEVLKKKIQEQQQQMAQQAK